MASAVQDALADVAFRLESLKAALSQRQEAGQLMAIKRMQQELDALLQPGAAEIPLAQQGDQSVAVAHGNDQPGAAFAAQVAGGVPPTPFDQRHAPAAGPSTAVKAAAPTPGGGAPATTPLAAEVLASLNALGGSGSAAATAARVVDTADGDAAATLSGLFAGGLEARHSGAGSVSMRAQQAQQQEPLPALVSLLQEASLGADQPPVHAAAMAAAAAAAAAPALPVARRQSAGGAALLPGGGAAQREQRPCNCKRSMCLKMYCECFAAGGFCAASCSCLNCSNTPADTAVVRAARDIVLAKNPRAFEVKVTAVEGHKRGCRCKRSKCLKKYCECFHAGARCNPDVCQCEDCRNSGGDAMLMPVCGQEPGGWAEASADVLAMFQAPLPIPTAADALSGGSAGASGARRGRARVQALPPLPLPASTAGFAFPAMPEPVPAASLPAFTSATAAAAAAVLNAFQPGAMLAPPSAPAFDPAAAAAFLLNPVAAAAAATFAAAATLAEQQQLAQVEESMAEAASFPAAVAPPAAAQPAAGGSAAPVAAATPKVASALTSHLSDMLGMADSDMYDTATSPAPHMAIAKLASRHALVAVAAAPTLTGGVAGALGRPPLPGSRVRSRAQAGDSQLSQGSGDENDSHNSAGSHRSKRPRRAASGGVLGAVAAEASHGGLEMVSPPLKRAASLPQAAPEQQQGGKPGGARAKVSQRVALLKKALVAETAAAAAAAGGAGPAPPGIRPCLLDTAALQQCATTAEDEDAISALFELSSSMC